MRLRVCLARTGLAALFLAATVAAAQTQAQPELDVPYVPTSEQAVQAMLKLADVKKNDIV